MDPVSMIRERLDVFVCQVSANFFISKIRAKYGKCKTPVYLFSRVMSFIRYVEDHKFYHLYLYEINSMNGTKYCNQFFFVYWVYIHFSSLTNTEKVYILHILIMLFY